jgi:hypothetical protein
MNPVQSDAQELARDTEEVIASVKLFVERMKLARRHREICSGTDVAAHLDECFRIERRLKEIDPAFRKMMRKLRNRWIKKGLVSEKSAKHGDGQVQFGT